MKFLLCSVFVLALAGAACAFSQSWGVSNSTDVLLSRETVIRQPVKNNYWTINIDYPKSGTTNNRTITAVNVFDNFRNTSGASPSLYSGGPGWRFATVNLKGQISRGLNSTVEFWGRR